MSQKVKRMDATSNLILHITSKKDIEKGIDVITRGEGIYNLKRMYNNRLGISRKDDFLPPRFLTRNRKGEDLTNQLPPMGRLLSDYYEYRGWTEDGKPSDEKLKILGLK